MALGHEAAGVFECGPGAGGEYAVVPAQSLVKTDNEIPLDEAALFCCAVLTGMGAVVNTAQIYP